ncbi:STAS domain-containing protein [Kitasatospora sp. SolWspMP-SS2h]|uniref:STAS domain-containing protein n=1 Tax=Kitasatospora sp. SolWspMP-SS2h TaxID=1305729 RepID=UPI0018F46940|nr:STAS domain-containing protein [Kitasatospora sp. SolWspMP-SS2h]
MWARGQLDWDRGQDFADRLEAALRAGAGTVVVNVSGLEFVDSSVLNTLLAAHGRQRAAGGALVLEGPLLPTVEGFFGITGVLGYFTFADASGTDGGQAAADPAGDGVR